MMPPCTPHKDEDLYRTYWSSCMIVMVHCLRLEKGVTRRVCDIFMDSAPYSSSIANCHSSIVAVQGDWLRAESCVTMFAAKRADQ